MRNKYVGESEKNIKAELHLIIIYGNSQRHNESIYNREWK